MAGKQRRNAIGEELQRRTRASFTVETDDEVTASTLDYVCLWLENGQTLMALARELSDKLHAEITAGLIQRSLNAIYGQESVEREIGNARLRASHSYAESALALVDEPADSNVEVSRAASRARSRQWLAERYNPKQYGQQRDSMTVTLSVGELHLAALQATSRIMPIVPAAPVLPIEQSNRLTSSSQRTDTEDAEVVTP